MVSQQLPKQRGGFSLKEENHPLKSNGGVNKVECFDTLVRQPSSKMLHIQADLMIGLMNTIGLGRQRNTRFHLAFAKLTLKTSCGFDCLRGGLAMFENPVPDLNLEGVLSSGANA